jgi:hypothetical protein
MLEELHLINVATATSNAAKKKKKFSLMSRKVTAFVNHYAMETAVPLKRRYTPTKPDYTTSNRRKLSSNIVAK